MNTAVLLRSSGERPACFSQTSACYGARLSPGRCVAGKYVIRGVLGEGGFAVVYEAEHVTLSVPVAIKVLHISAHTTQELLGRFRQEAKICASIHHMNILSVHDAGTLDDGSPFLVMEHIRGETLHARIGHGVLPIVDVIKVALQLTDALCGLAALSIVHCDIKPKNLMLERSEGGEVNLRLVDFGIATFAPNEHGTRSILSSELLGTPHYMSPEHLRGEAVDTRTDLYAAGVVLYEALTGELPYRGETLAELSEARRAERTGAIRRSRRDCPKRLERIVLKAIEPDREARYASAREMRLDLERCARSYARRHPLPRSALRTKTSAPAPHKSVWATLCAGWAALRQTYAVVQWLVASQARARLAAIAARSLWGRRDTEHEGSRRLGSQSSPR